MYFMLIIRALIFILILYALWLLVFGESRTSKHDQPKTQNNTPNSDKTWVQCHQCGLLIEFDEAIQYKDRFYCSVEHLEADSQTSP